MTPFSPTFKVEAGTVVECIHEYIAVDDDELSFATGDVITVVDWDSTDEQVGARETCPTLTFVSGHASGRL